MTMAKASLIDRYLAAVAEPFSTEAFQGLFAPDVEFDVPGAHPLAGKRYGPRACLEYLSELARATGGTYGIDRVIDCLGSPRGGGLIVRESFCMQGVSFAWTRFIYFEIDQDLIRKVTFFESDQRGLDAMLALEATSRSS